MSGVKSEIRGAVNELRYLFLHRLVLEKLFRKFMLIQICLESARRDHTLQESLPLVLISKILLNFLKTAAVVVMIGYGKYLLQGSVILNFYDFQMDIG